MAYTAAGPLRHEDKAARLTVHRYSGFLFRALVLLIALVMLLPLAYLLFRAGGVGWNEVLRLLGRTRLPAIMWNSLLLVCGVTTFSLALALPYAWLTERTDLPGRRIWTVLGMMPLVIPSYVGGFTLIAMFGPRGVLQELLSPFGVERLPSIYGYTGALWILTLFTYPYIYISIRAALHRFDPSLEEAARSLGYNGLQTFLRVTLPNLRPAITAGGLLVALYTLSDFGAVSLLRFNSFTRAIYVQFLSSFDRNVASLLSLALIVFTIILLLLERKSRGRGRPRYYRSSAGVSAPRKRVELGRSKWPALAFCGAVVLSALVLPTGVILFWLLRGLASGEPLAPVWEATLNSFRAGALAAIAAAVLGLPVAYAAVRMGGRLMSFASRAVYLGYGLPGIVIALSLVFFGANFALWLYQTMWMLVFAYVVRFLPQAVGAMQTSFQQMNPRLEEAGRSLGLGNRAVFRRITAPIVRPGVLAGMALVFLTTVKELPATLLLSPTGFSTLATQIWSATDEAFFTRAAAPALVLLAMSALSIFLVLMQEEKEVVSG
ncbi:MAG: iron ABC transporter permease [Caldilineaceae bacterium SB0664_bin_27]|uniref:Iron ABC transporter permease n=1 Tax=Caldilineaceae bacterium SB0664_bin_27 TaxID=2605260 RepID=A0A6B0YUL4_9CHLR|nr:iron ABC transporter permease [Caldilineaceae bacterium SB0664_bin_27]